MEQNGNPYNNLLPEVPELGQVFCHPEVTGALASILGDGYYLHLHRRCHDRTAGEAADRAAAALAAALADQSHYVRGYAALGLRRLDTPAARRDLLAHLESARWDPARGR